MRYAITINLDYQSNPADECRDVWGVLKDNMISAGFRNEGRLFTISMTEHDACDRARLVVESMVGHPSLNGKDVYLFLKDFYGFGTGGMTNLLLPPSEGIQIDE